MKRNTQKFVFLALAAAVLSSFFFTCIPFGPPDDYEEFNWTNVEYSPDGKSLTIYLDGSMPVRQDRAINLKWAQIGHDFFEVAFHDPASGKTARALWETGHAAGVSGVARGVDYDSAVIFGLAAGHGAAIMFVGKKSDKTLLALGKLTGVDDEISTLITADSKKVTFSVAAIDVGVREKRTAPYPVESIQSSFLTSELGGSVVSEPNTVTTSVGVGMLNFPLFQFAANNHTVNANYTFKLDPNSGFFINDFNNGIRLAGPAVLAIAPPDMNLGSSEYHLIPRYPTGNGLHSYAQISEREIISTTSGTQVTIINNLTAHSAFANPVQFRLVINGGNDGRMFAFTFHVPVYSLINAASPGVWYLRPGYDSYNYDLDDGAGGTGGAILIGTGTFTTSSYRLWIRETPTKSVYPGSPESYLFNLNGTIVDFMIGDTTLLNLITHPDHHNTNLKFYVQNKTAPITKTYIEHDDDLQDYFLSSVSPPTPNTDYITDGMLTIYAEYLHTNGITYTESFPLFLYTEGGVPDADLIPEEHRFIIANEHDFLAFQTFVQNYTGPLRNFIIVIFNSLNLNAQIVVAQRSYFIIIAARPNVTVGLGSGLSKAFNIQPGTAQNSTFYLGVWPFTSTLSAQGKAITSYPLTLNSGAGVFIDSSSPEIIKGPGFEIIGNLTP